MVTAKEEFVKIHSSDLKMVAQVYFKMDSKSTSSEHAQQDNVKKMIIIEKFWQMYPANI